MKTQTYAMAALALLPALLVFSPTANASEDEVCIELSEETSGTITCIHGLDLQFSGERPTALATIYWYKIGVLCTYEWYTKVTSPSGIWTYAQGEVSPIPDQKGATNHNGAVNSAYSGNGIPRPLVPTGTVIKVVAEISGTSGKATSTAIKVC